MTKDGLRGSDTAIPGRQRWIKSHEEKCMGVKQSQSLL